ncbi:hypothetical protein [Oceanotoga phage vB_OteS-UFV02]
MEKITIDNKIFDILDVTIRVIRKIGTNESLNGKLRTRVFGSRFAFLIFFDDLTEENMKEIYELSTKNSMLMSYNNKEYFVSVIDDNISYGTSSYNLDGEVFYSGVQLELQEVVPDREVNSV